MKGKKILYVNQEVEPYIVGSHLAQQGGNLPRAALERGAEVRTFIPKYGIINERRNQLHDVHRLSGLNLMIAKEDYTLIIKVASIQGTRLQVYFIDNLEFFSTRHGILHDETDMPYTDNDRRGVFFAKGVLETIKKLRWMPDLIHCNGWFASYVPPMVRLAYKHDPLFSKVKIVTSLYEDNLDELVGVSLKESATALKLPEEEVTQLADGTHRVLSELAIRYSDAVLVGDMEVDPQLLTYAQEQGKQVHELRTTEPIETVYEKIFAHEQAKV
jgi:hypothetical protein